MLGSVAAADYAGSVLCSQAVSCWQQPGCSYVALPAARSLHASDCAARPVLFGSLYVCAAALSTVNGMQLKLPRARACAVICS